MSYADYPQILQNIENFGGKTNIVEHFNVNESAKVYLDYPNENRIGIIAPNYINNPSIETESYKIQIRHPNYKKTCGENTHYPVKTPTEIIDPSSDNNLNIPSDKILLEFNIDDDITKLTNNDQIDITIKKVEGKEAAIMEDDYKLNRCSSSNIMTIDGTEVSGSTLSNIIIIVCWSLLALVFGYFNRRLIFDLLFSRRQKPQNSEYLNELKQNPKLKNELYDQLAKKESLLAARQAARQAKQ